VGTVFKRGVVILSPLIWPHCESTFARGQPDVSGGVGNLLNERSVKSSLPGISSNLLLWKRNDLSVVIQTSKENNRTIGRPKIN